MSQEGRRPNRLARETSPYLRQHAYNPVDWYPWGEEALACARREDKPIFLSVGYSACHWCHVMERESFEDGEIAGLLNQGFVSIKVDREERPDIDAVYMEAVQGMSGSGGWPMSVFLTADLKPFWGGTYFPPKSRHGMPGFSDILRELSRVYREQRGEVEEQATRMTQHLAAGLDLSGTDLPGHKALETATSLAARRFDPQHGGFGPAPKFPRALEVSMLLRSWARSGDTNALTMCDRTLEAMAHGGLYDQIGGGFHRYSTDARWLVPHFEKMLYDNALLVRTYLEAFQVSGRPLYRRIAAEVLEYVLREMTSPDGGFYSATDADSEGREGAFFVWTPSEVEEVVGGAAARLVCLYYGITDGGNFEEHTSIPHVTHPLSEVARLLSIEPGEAEEILATARAKLYAARSKRPKPLRDEKILTAWNALMISALARGAQVLGDERYAEAAARAARLVLGVSTAGAALPRVRMAGEARIDGFLDDHAYSIEALLDLYETRFDPDCLERARELAGRLLEDFWDGAGGLYYTSRHAEKLIARKKDPFDSATPSGNGVAALSLLRLERLTGEARFRAAAEALLRGVARAVADVPMAFASTLLAVDFLAAPPLDVAVVGDLCSLAGQSFLAAVHGGFLPARTIAAAAQGEVDGLGSRVPLLRGKGAGDSLPRAYVCRDFACQAPVTSAEELRAQLPFVTVPEGWYASTHR